MLRVQHTTLYRYARPVSIGTHRLMCRPRDSHDLRLLDATLTVSPPPAATRWLHDVFGNSVAILEFDAMASELRFVNDIRLEQYPGDHPLFVIAESARTYPFTYSAEEIPDLGRTIERHYSDPEHRVDTWAKRFATPSAQTSAIETQTLLERMTTAIHDELTYLPRDAEGTQNPAETLRLGTGSCRDFALLMMEAARSLGFAARFVSGYQYDPARDGEENGTTHAWVQIYLPGAGWVEFDPTHGTVGNKNLIRVAVARDPRQAIPLAGEWTGVPADYLGMTVSVRVTATPGHGR